MSRIYEALQKAESEKDTGRPGEEVEARPAGRRAYATHTALAEYEQRFHLEDPSDDPALESGDLLGHADVLDRAFDERAIPSRPWSPSLQQLPALMERGPGVEQFRSLRSRVYEMRDIKPLKSILISSALPQEGKSFVAANLAISLARNRNSRVLLVDGDMRRSTLHRLLGCNPEPGLADYLAGKSTMLEVMQRPDPASTSLPAGMRAGGMPALSFIGGGDGGDRAADLSGNYRFPELLAAAAPLFDWIVVDSSPVVPVSDAVNLARSCDGVLLVARGGVTDFTMAQKAQSELRAANVLGFVLNAVERPAHSVGYYGYDREKEQDGTS